MLFHHGRPQPINFRAPFLSAVRTLYTSTLSGFGGSTPADLPTLRRLALVSRARQPPEIIAQLVAQIAALLRSMPRLEIAVLSLHTRLATTRSRASESELGPWTTALAPLRADARFEVLPFARPARAEWEHPSVFADAAVDSYSERTQSGGDGGGGGKNLLFEMIRDAAAEEASFHSWPPSREWDLDVHQAPGYVHGKTGVEYPGTPARA
jgi:hypothetical protein